MKDIVCAGLKLIVSRCAIRTRCNHIAFADIRSRMSIKTELIIVCETPYHPITSRIVVSAAERKTSGHRFARSEKPASVRRHLITVMTTPHLPTPSCLFTAAKIEINTPNL